MGSLAGGEGVEVVWELLGVRGLLLEWEGGLLRWVGRLLLLLLLLLGVAVVS